MCRDEPETLLLLKAPRRRLDALTARIKELHPYDEPVISALPVVGGSASYLRWVAREATGGEGAGAGGEEEGGGGSSSRAASPHTPPNKPRHSLYRSCSSSAITASARPLPRAGR